MTPIELLNEFLLALCVWREARGESVQGKAFVAQVIINRANDPAKRWPRTIQGVVCQPFQFSSFNRNDLNVNLYPKESDTSWVESVEAARNALTSNPPMTKANHYHVVNINPAWANPAKVTEIVGNHKFYLL